MPLIFGLYNRLFEYVFTDILKHLRPTLLKNLDAPLDYYIGDLIITRAPVSIQAQSSVLIHSSYVEQLTSFDISHSYTVPLFDVLYQNF